MQWTLSFLPRRTRIALAVTGSFCLMAIWQHPALAELVTISTSAPTGTQDHDSSTDFVGILDGISPETINLLTVEFDNVPAGEAFAVGDLAGRDMNGHNGSDTWQYSLSLPSDAVDGTGFENILFSGHVFEGDNNNLDNSDLLTWELFVNGVSVDSYTTGSQDFDPFDFTLTDVGGSGVTDILAVFTVDGFTSGNEWFVTRGSLSATYTSIPEPTTLIFVALAAIACFPVRRRRKNVS